MWSFHRRIIDVTGQIVASTNCLSGLASAQVDLEKAGLHTNRTAATLLELQTRVGDRIALAIVTEEHIVTLQSNDPDLPVTQLIRAFELAPFREDHTRAERIQDAARPALVAGEDGAR